MRFIHSNRKNFSKNLLIICLSSNMVLLSSYIFANTADNSNEPYSFYGQPEGDINRNYGNVSRPVDKKDKKNSNSLNRGTSRNNNNTTGTAETHPDETNN